MRKLLYIALCSLASLSAGEFDTKVLPILKARCLPCHDEATHTSGFVATNLAAVVKGGAQRGQAVKPGDPGDSPLVNVLNGKLKPQMPLGGKLSDAEVGTISAWIASDAPEISAVLPKTDKYWAFVKPVKPKLPEVRDSAWVRNDIDRFILAKLEAKGLKPAPEAGKRTLIRRLYFDLIGLPPTPEEVKAFEEDASPKAYQELVEKLLADPRYGERWGRHWLDLARYADTNGYEEDTEFTHAWRYRDYVVKAFNADKPYDKFVMEQLAGDEWAHVGGTAVPEPEPEKVVAVSFLRMAPLNKTPVSDENRDSLLSEMTSTVSSVFMGLTVGCAKCHDHKYDSIPQRDFYRMKAFFATIQIHSGGRVGGTEPAAFDKSQEAWVEAARTDKKQQIEKAKKSLADFEAPLIERLKTHRKKEVTSADLRRALDTELNNAAGFDKTDDIFSGQERADFNRLNERVIWLEKELVRLEPRAWSLHDADGPPLGPSVPTTYVQIRGDFDRMGEPVEPGFPSAITGNSKPADLDLDPYRMFPMRGRRMTLARWIASPENPLTSRVMVNRIWHWHFGRGIVETTSDFGKNGSQPSNPELLDWLAVQFTEQQWSIKAMHRLMVLSSTYRQSSQTVNEAAATADPENHLLWRFNGRRVEGEAIRDSVLYVAGRLNPERGGPPVFPVMPKDLEVIKIKGVNTWETSYGPETLKRSLYVFQRRSSNYPFLEVMDAAVPTATCERRRTSITALQSLSMYNSEFVNEEAKHFADRVKKEAGADPRARLERAFELAYDRRVSPREEKRMLDLMKSAPSADEGLFGLCRVLFNSNEFMFMD